KQITFRRAAEAYIAAHEAGWKNAKHAWQWNKSLELYAFPRIGELDVGDIGMAQVLDVLEPIWRTKTKTASRPAPSKVAKPKHHAALPVSEASSFLRTLRQQEG